MQQFICCEREHWQHKMKTVKTASTILQEARRFFKFVAFLLATL